jgi:hypothetical protein
MVPEKAQVRVQSELDVQGVENNFPTPLIPRQAALLRKTHRDGVPHHGAGTALRNRGGNRLRAGQLQPRHHREQQCGGGGVGRATRHEV